MHNHRHNGLYGTLKLIRSHLKGLDNAPSFTYQALYLVAELRDILYRLEREVWENRRELDGSAVRVKHKRERI